ncbi:MAG TPA: hypothetical protein VHL57_03805 [Flavobacteriales bacterium]|jgi:hypothetical protein|nr:hypothetical protein [Flavobacteriales bacterium]
MSDEAQSNLGIPCDGCHAQAGEPCLPECPNLADSPWDGYEFADLEATEYAMRSPDESMAVVMANINLLPFGALVGTVPERSFYDEDEFLDRLATWMADYQQVLNAKVDEMQAQVREGISLKIGRDILRAHLGVAS